MSRIPYPLWAALVPLLAGTLSITVVAVSERVGWPAAAAVSWRNSAEAAAAGDPVFLQRALWRGENPLLAYDIRPELISTSVLRATTLEAAVWSRQVEMIQLLDRRGFIVDRATRRALTCLAADLKVDDIVEYLIGSVDDRQSAEEPCEPAAALRRVQARTTDPDGAQ